ncbi:hypothetical protein [Rhizobium rhizogenes]|uniref:hypothetical protein n=1 Tax=Rhizobium rhizogenes TaxID=359 RepID=UPI001571EAEE|nr:hypothetical protein [Rhizobium rhizogenes]NTF96017.1 hypothetical protein [Rhizobium rhizogenes]
MTKLNTADPYRKWVILGYGLTASCGTILAAYFLLSGRLIQGGVCIIAFGFSSALLATGLQISRAMMPGTSKAWRIRLGLPAHSLALLLWMGAAIEQSCLRNWGFGAFALAAIAVHAHYAFKNIPKRWFRRPAKSNSELQ